MMRNHWLFRRIFQLMIMAVFLSVYEARANADKAIIAVASNFTEAAVELARQFEERSGHTISISTGSTGQLYTQIVQGAPYHAYLAADALHPAKSIDEGIAVPGSQFTYAVGTLVLYSQAPGIMKGSATLRSGLIQKLAIANPEIAPYGAAAVEVMKTIGVYERFSKRLVMGKNIAQTYQFVTSGNAEAGFVAKSQVRDSSADSYWEIPKTLHAPLKQDAVLLKQGQNNSAARAFLDFLQSSLAQDIIAKYGYVSLSDY